MPARSFRLVSFCFEGFCLETASCKVFHCQLEPKDAELRPRLAQEKDRVLRALFFTQGEEGKRRDQTVETRAVTCSEIRVSCRADKARPLPGAQARQAVKMTRGGS